MRPLSWTPALRAAPALLIAAASEVAFVHLLLQDRLPGCAAAHALASAATAWAIHAALHGRRRAGRVRSCVGAAALVLGMPGLGLLGVVFVVMPALCATRASESDELRRIPRPRYEAGRAAAEGVSADSAALLSGTLAQRVEALKALRQMAPQRALPALRRALDDPSEDVRLLAFAIVEQGERGLRARIESCEARLSGTQLDREERRHLHLRVAELTFELAHAGYVAGDGVPPLLEQITRHAQRARGGACEGAACVLLARVHLRSASLKAAAAALEGAQQAGASQGVWRPLQAELHYLQGRFEAVRAELFAIPELAARRPVVGPLVRHWGAR